MDIKGTREGPPIPAHHLRIVIVANHMNGKDTHIRGLKIFGPPESWSVSFDIVVRKLTRRPVAKTSADDMGMGEGLPDGPALVELGQDRSAEFKSQRFRMYDGIR